MDTSNYNHHPDHPLSEEEESIPHSIKRRSKRSKKKHNSQVSAQTTPTSSSTSITDSRRTSLQTPIQHIVDSWEEEESEDELYVDAPEFLPDSTSSNNSVSANIVKNSVVSEDSKKSLLLDQKFSNFVGGLSSFEGGVSSRKPPKPVSKIPKTRTVSKSEEGRITGVVSSSRKNTRTTQNTRTHSDIPCWTGDTLLNLLVIGRGKTNELTVVQSHLMYKRIRFGVELIQGLILLLITSIDPPLQGLVILGEVLLLYKMMTKRNLGILNWNQLLNGLMKKRMKV